jgi:hypothetical protein
LHAAVSRCPPISLCPIVARPEAYTQYANVWDLSIVQGISIFCRPVPTIRNFFFHRCSRDACCDMWTLDAAHTWLVGWGISLTLRCAGSGVNILTVLIVVAVGVPIIGLIFAYQSYGVLWG